MKSQLIALAVTTIAVAAVPHDAQAAYKCADIAIGDKAACEAAVAKECTTGNGADKIACQRRIAERFDSCSNGDMDKACKAASDIYWGTCRKMHDLDMNKPESVQAWKKRLLGYEHARAGMEKFKETWGACLQQSNCQVSDSWIRQCGDKALEKAKKTFRENVDFWLRANENTLNHARNAMKRKNYENAMSFAKSGKDKLTVFFDLMRALPWLDHKEAELKAAVKELEDLYLDALKKNEAALAARVCPKGSHNDPARAKRLAPAVKAFFKDYDDVKVAVKVFRFDGKLQRGNDYIWRREVQTQPAVVCLQKKRPGKTYCQAFEISLTRSRPIGGRWGDWKVGVGASDDLLCKNVK